MFLPPGWPNTALVDIAVDQDDEYSIYATHVNSGTQYGIVADGVTIDGESSKTVDMTSWQNGVVSITVFVSGEVHSFQYFKS